MERHRQHLAVGIAGVILILVALLIRATGGASVAVANGDTGTTVATYASSGRPSSTPTWRILHRVLRSNAADSAAVATDGDLTSAEAAASVFASRVAR
jgi:hypothetical protein